MLYIDLIDDAPITLTANQLKLAVQEATLLGREEAFSEAADMFETYESKAYAIQHLRDTAHRTRDDREMVARQGLATRGLVS